MSSYLLLKWVHILASTILFGTGLGIAFFQWMTWRSGDLAAIARVTSGMLRDRFGLEG